MKDKIKEFFQKNGRLAILILFILEIVLTIFITPNKFDDKYFIEKITNNSIINFVGDRYNWWSSRLIIEFVLCFMLKTSKYLWILVEAFMVALAGYSISKIFIKDNKNENTIMLVFMILFYPLNVMASAGWGATTVNYMWPLATGLFALIPIKKIWNNEKIKSYEYPLYIIAGIFSANQEQAAAILLGSYLLFSVLMIIKNKKIHPYMVIKTLIIIGCVVFILTCPGNYLRSQAEIKENFKDLEMFTFFDKVALGLTSTIGILVGKGNLVYLLLSLLIAVYICSNYKEKIYKIVSVIPLLSSVIVYYANGIGIKFFPYISGSFKEIIVKHEVMLTAANSNNLLYTVPLIFACVNFICIALSLLIIFKNLKNNIAIVVFFAGLASRIIMGFSASIWASGERTMIFFEFAMIIISILIWQELIKGTEKNDKKVQKRTGTLIKFVGSLQYINVLLCILMTQK